MQQGQGARGSPDPLWPLETRGLGEKKEALLCYAKVNWGCGLSPEESLPFQNAALRTSFGVVGEMGP